MKTELKDGVEYTATLSVTYVKGEADVTVKTTYLPESHGDGALPNDDITMPPSWIIIANIKDALENGETP